MTENKHLRRALYCLYAAGGVLAAWLFLRYALPWLLPFIIGLVAAHLMEPAVRYMTSRLKWRRGAASALCTVLLFAVAVAAASLAVGRVVVELTAFVREMPSLLSGLTKTLAFISERVEVYISSAPPEVRGYLRSALESLFARSAEIPAALSGKILAFLSAAAQATPKFILFFFTCALSVFFMSSGYREITSFIMRQIPKGRHAAMREFKADLFSTFGKWLKAELKLCALTFFEMAVAFLLMRIDFAILLALLVALVDALPIVGTGTVLLPWAAVALITGSAPTSAALVALYALNVAVRNLLEPKLIGEQIGLPPIATLLAMYVGFSSAGVIGMALFPIALIMLKHLNDKGYLRLWK